MFYIVRSLGFFSTIIKILIIKTVAVWGRNKGQKRAMLTLSPKILSECYTGCTLDPLLSLCLWVNRWHSNLT